ncbi:MAG: hypothetical protein WDM80_09980 [Limisphaerales bacterium]
MSPAMIESSLLGPEFVPAEAGEVKGEGSSASEVKTASETNMAKNRNFHGQAVKSPSLESFRMRRIISFFLD